MFNAVKIKKSVTWRSLETRPKYLAMLRIRMCKDIESFASKVGDLALSSISISPKIKDSSPLYTKTLF